MGCVRLRKGWAVFKMFIAIHELDLHPIKLDAEFQPGTIDLGPDVLQQTVLVIKGRAELLEEHQGRAAKIADIRLRGNLSTKLEVSCARCLEPVALDVAREFDLMYRPEGVDGGRDEISVTQAEAEIGYYTGEGLLLEDFLREQVLLSVPIKTLCREDCKGLCPYCGKNLNIETCSCKVEPKDPRWDALKSFKV
jgi:uncharacterized protein